MIQGGCVLSQDAAIGNLETGDVLIRDGKVIQVGPLIIPEHETIVIDATDAIVIPGFVDAHVHAGQGQLRGTAPALDFRPA